MISGSRVFREANKYGVNSKDALTLDRDDQLGNNGQDLGTTLLEHVKDSLDRQESVGVLLLADTLEEDGEVVMVVKLHHVHLPVDLVLGSVLNRDGQVTSVVETAELGRLDGSAGEGTGLGLLRNRSGLGLVQGSGLTTKSVSLFQNS